MYDRRFFRTKLGQAALASIVAMAVFVATSSQMAANPALAGCDAVGCGTVELA